MHEKKRYRLIACEVMFREICLCVAKSRNIVDVSFVKQGYHDIGDKKMREKLQEEINKIDVNDYDAILLGYGLCNNGVKDLHAKIPLVIPRAHDCITLLMGSKEVYKEYFFSNPGTYFLSSGWIERDDSDIEGSIPKIFGLDKGFDQFAEVYDEETLAYLAEILGDTTVNYNKISFINTNTGTTAKDRQVASERAKDKNWEFEEISGDISLISDLLDGVWDENKYLVVPPGKTIAPSYDDNIIRLK